MKTKTLFLEIICAVAIILLLFGCCWAVRWFLFRPNIFSYSLVFTGLVVPSICILICCKYFAKNTNGWKVLLLFLVLAAVASLFFTNIYAIENLGYRYFQDRNLANYPKYVNDEYVNGKYVSDKYDFSHSPNLMPHLPKNIPEKAIECSFFSGRNIDLKVLQLRCVLPDSEVRKIEKNTVPLAKYLQNGCPARNGDKSYLFTEFRNMANTAFEPLSADFLMIVLDIGFIRGGTMWGGESLELWQEDYSCGIAINKKTNEVIYWATYF